MERAEWLQEFWDQVAQDLLVAFVNTRDKYGNSAMHLAVEHHNESSLQFLLQKQDILKEDVLLKKGAGDAEYSSAVVCGNESAGNAFNEFSGKGRASLTLLNWKNFTPFTLSVHLARADDKKSLNSYRTILECGYRQTVWQFGVHDMHITSLYQIDTFRVRSKHSKEYNGVKICEKEYKSQGIFGSTCTECGQAKKAHFQHSNGKKYCTFRGADGKCTICEKSEGHHYMHSSNKLHEDPNYACILQVLLIYISIYMYVCIADLKPDEKPN